MASETDSSRRQPCRFPRLPQGELWLWAICMCGLLGFLGVHLVRQHWLSKRMIDIEHAPQRQADFRVNLNTTAWPELTVLPGISETYARRIVEYRDQNGAFHDLEDLAKVRGIGRKTLNRIRPFVYIESAAKTERASIAGDRLPSDRLQ